MKREIIKWGMVIFTAFLFTLFLSFAARAQTNCTPTPTGLVAWWPGDGFALDVAGTNNGTLQNGAGYVAGKAGQGFSLNGSSSYVQTPNNPLWAFGTNNFTIELWANFAATSGSRALISFDTGSGGQNKWIFWLNGGFLQFHINGSLGTANIGTGAFSPVIGTWYHLAVTRNNTNYVFYTNGVAVVTNGNIVAIPSTIVPLTIGQAESNFFFSGTLDEVSIYTRALASSEVAAIYSAGSSGKCFTNSPAPVFVQNPASQTNYVGTAFMLTGAALGTPRPQYQWLTNGVPLPGGTNAFLSFNNPTTNQSGAYSLIASNFFGSATSSVANVKIIVSPFVLTGTEGFESGFDGWTTDNTNVWQVGKPVAGPGAAYAGTNCAGTGLTGNVPTFVSSSLTSPGFVVPAANQNPRMRWWQWFHFGNSYNGTDIGYFQISTNNGTSWQTLLSVGGEGASSGGWTEPSVDLSAYAGQSVQIAFYLQSGNEGNGGGPGWFVDSVMLVTGTVTTLTPNVPVDFESGLGDWSVNNGLWQVGKPTAGPGAAYAGTNCAGTGLTGNVPTFVSSSLTSPGFVVPAANQNPRMRWWQWFHFGNSYNGTDIGYFQISTNNGTSWQTLLSVGGEGASSGGWTEPSVDLSAYAGQSVQIAFYLQSGNEGNGGGPGWFVDSVMLVTGTVTTLTPNVPVDFESGLGDWSVNNGLWQVGKPTAGPGAAYAGTNCAGTGLTGNVPTFVSSSLTSPGFVVPAANQNPRMRWWQWFHFGNSYNGTDIGYFQISTNNGTSWQTLLSVGGEGASSGGWTEPSVDLSAYAGQSVQIAFYLQSGNEGNGGGPGWFVDSVMLVTGTVTTLTPNVPVDFESGLGDWSVNNGLWQVGKPTAGPGAAYAGTNCAGTGLTGNVPTFVSSSLTSPGFVVPAANQNPRMRWWQWFHFGNSYNGTDIGYFQISTNNGTSWQTLLSVGGEGASSGGWTEPSVDLSAYAGQSVQIAFYLQSGNEGNGGGPGWFVDNVMLRVGPEVFNNPETFEFGWGDWDTDNYGLWQIGIPTFGPPLTNGSRAHSPVSVAATILNGNYPASSSGRLISPSFIVPSINSGSVLTLRFWQYYQYGTGDAGLVQIAPTFSPTNWTTLTVAATNGTSTNWTQAIVDLTPYQGQQVRVGFYHSANGDGSVGAGWYLDDVSLSSFVPNQLTLGVPFTNVFSANGQYQYFVVQAPSGGHLLVNLNALGASGANEIYLSRGVLPTPGSYDYRFTVNGSANQTVFVPNAGAGPWYVLAYNAAGAVPETYTLTAQFLTGIFLTSVTPTNVGNSVASSITINGAGFAPNDVVTLVNGGNTYTASNVFAVSASQIIADFNFPAIPPANYQLTVSSGTDSAALPFTVIQGIGPKLITQLHVPSRIGYHQPSIIYVEYSNTGDAPMPAPMLTLSAEQNGLQGAILTLDPSQFGVYFWSYSLPEGFQHSVQFLASGATPGLLQPGESRAIPVYYAGWQFSLVAPGNPLIYFHLGILTATNTNLVDWLSLKDNMRPSATPTDAWNAIFVNFTNRVGVTWGGYVRALDDNATYLAKLGENVTDIPNLLSFIIQQVSGLSAIRTLTGYVDAQMTAPGPGLVFRRTFTTDIGDHYRLGRLGRGWFDNWDITLSVTNNTQNGQPGTVTVLGPGSSRRVFQPDSRNTENYFTTISGDFSTLTSLGGGAYLVREIDGTQYAFRPDGRLDFVADPHGTRITASYSGSQLTQLTHSTGPNFQFSYNGHGRIATVTDSFGRQTSFAYDGSGEHLISVVNYRGEQTGYTYSIGQGEASEHALTQVINPDGTMLNFTFNSAGRLATRAGCCGAIEQMNYAYDSVGTVTITDANTNITKNYFDYQGLLVRAQDPLGNITQRTFDGNGNLVQVVDAAGRTRSSAYDARGNRVSDTDQLGFTTRFAYTPDFGKLATLVDAKGNTTTYAYQTNGDLMSAVYADSSVERWGYDSLGNRLSWINRRAQPVSHTNDAAGRVISRLYPDGSIVTFNYDARGNLTNYTDATGNTAQKFDTNDRLSKITYPGGQWLQYTYLPGGRRASMTDQLTNRLNYYYDTRGRLQSLSDASGSNIVTYAYDTVGRLLMKTLGNGIYTIYGYDPAGQMLDVFNHKANGALLSRFQYAYDSRGRRTTMTTTYGANDTRNGIAGVWNYNYDDDGQLVGWTAPGGRIVSYVYDATGNRLFVNDAGTNIPYSVNKLNQYTQAGATTFQYDTDGNLTNQTTVSGKTAFTWSADNKLIQVNSPTATWQNVFDGLGYRTSAQANGALSVFIVDHSGLGNVIGEYSSGGVLRKVYNYGKGLVSQKDNVSNSAFYSFDALGDTSELSGNLQTNINIYAYLPFGELLVSAQANADEFQQGGESGVMTDGNGLIFMRARSYQSQTGRFISLDPIGLGGGDVNLYRYARNNVLSFIDPMGLKSCPPPNFSSCFDPYSKCLACFALYWNPPAMEWCFGICGAYETIETAQCVANKYAEYLRCLYQPQPPGPPPPPPPCNPPDCDNGDPGNPSQPSQPQDPNSLVGPMGYGTANYISTTTLLPYSIQFENATNATAPAQSVVVSDQLTNTLDWTSFALTEIAFGNTIIAMPSGSQHYANTFHLTQDGFNFDVQIDVGLNPATGLLQAKFTSVNPTNGLPPPVDVGFLPPETSPATGIGTGYINYTVRPKAGLATGAQIRNVAAITFDINAAIATDLIDENNVNSGHDTNKQALVTIDAGLPTSSVITLATNQPNAAFTVCWAGSDAGSGVVGFDVYVSTNGGPWILWQANTPNTCATFTGQNGKTYGFYSVARDGVGNFQVTPGGAQTTTTVAPSNPNLPKPIPGLFNTGVTNAGVLMPPRTVDPHFILITNADVTSPGPKVYVVNSDAVNALVVNSWLTNGPYSEWIAPSNSAANSSSAGGVYVYRTTFNLTGFDSRSASITGAWATDDQGVDIRLNDSSKGFGSAGFGAWSSFAITNGFVAGLNSLDFVVSNYVSPSYNPTGLRVELAGVAKPVPQFSQVSYSPGGGVQLQLSIFNSGGYRIQGSTNLSNWIDLTNITTSGFTNITFIDSKPTNMPARFYRIVSP